MKRPRIFLDYASLVRLLLVLTILGFVTHIPAQAQVWESRITASDGISFTAGALWQNRAAFTGAGKAFIYERSENGSWIETTILEADDGMDFGNAIAIEGNVALIDGQGDCVYMFVRQNDGVWNQANKHCFEGDVKAASTIKLQGVAALGMPGHNIEGTIVGAVHVANMRHVDTWWEGQTLLIDDPESRDFCDGNPNCTTYESFGFSGDNFALSGSRIMMGIQRSASITIRDPEGGRPYYERLYHEDLGTVYVYENTTSGWEIVEKITLGADEKPNIFGHNIALLGDRALFTSSLTSPLPTNIAPVAYVFERASDGSWIRLGEILLPKGNDHDALSHIRLALGDNKAFILTEGKIRIYEPQNDGAWRLTDQLIPGNRKNLSDMLALSGNHVATLGADGAGYIFDHTVPADVAVTDFTLIDASTEAPVIGYDPMLAEVALDRTGAPPALSIRANTTGRVAKVVFDFQGAQNFRTEFFPPYSLFGDVKQADGTFNYTPAPNGTFDTGTYTVTATPYDAAGVAGTAASHTFTVKSFYTANPRAYYLGTGNHVHELAWSGGEWHENVLKVKGENAPPAAAASALVSFGVGDADDPRVYYLDTDNHVNELAWYSEAWHWRDLNDDAIFDEGINDPSITTPPAAAPGSALTGYNLGSKGTACLLPGDGQSRP